MPHYWCSIETPTLHCFHMLVKFFSISSTSESFDVNFSIPFSTPQLGWLPQTFVRWLGCGKEYHQIRRGDSSISVKFTLPLSSGGVAGSYFKLIISAWSFAFGFTCRSTKFLSLCGRDTPEIKLRALRRTLWRSSAKQLKGYLSEQKMCFFSDMSPRFLGVQLFGTWQNIPKVSCTITHTWVKFYLKNPGAYNCITILTKSFNLYDGFNELTYKRSIRFARVSQRACCNALENVFPVPLTPCPC